MSSFKKSSFPDSRLWQNGLAHSYITEGDQAECDKWLGWARQKLQAMLALPGTVSQIFEPVDGIQIDIYTRPHRIRIKAEGGVLVTVMDKLSLVGDYSNGNNPPFQARKARYLYLVTDSVSKRDDYYAGGTMMNLALPDYDPQSAASNRIIRPRFAGEIQKPGGSWYSDKKALSWVNDTNQVTLFFDGRFKVIAFPAASGWSLKTACLGGVDWIKTRFPLITQAYDLTFICIFKFSATPLQYHVYTYAYNINSNILTLLANAPLVNLKQEDQITAFDEAAHSLAYTQYNTVTVGGGDFRGSNQSVKKVVFTSDYSAFTTTEIYSQLVPLEVFTKDTVHETIDANTRKKTETQTRGIHEAGYWISQLRAENKHFTLLRHRLEALTFNYTFVATRVTAGSTTYSTTFSSSRNESWRHQIGTLRPDQNGVYQVTVVDDWIGTNQHTESGSGSYADGSGSDSFSSDIRFNRALFVSAYPPTCLLEERRFTDNGSATISNIFNPTGQSNTYAKEWQLVLRKKQANGNGQENISLASDAITFAPVFSATQFITPTFGVDIHDTDYPIAFNNFAAPYFALNYQTNEAQRYDPLAYSDKFLLYCFTQPVLWVATNPKTLKLDIKTGKHTLEDGRMDAPTGSLYTSPIGVTN